MAEKTITQLTAIDALATGDELAVYDASASSTKKATAAQVKTFATDVDINGLTSASPATGDSVAIYDASASANRKATLSDILALGGGGGDAMDINGLTSSTPQASDSLPTYSVGVGANRKVTVQSAFDTGFSGALSTWGTATPTGSDSILFFDQSAGWQKKVASVSDLGAALFTSGTWTPELRFGTFTTGITYDTARDGFWTRIGNMVYVQCRFTLTSKGTTAGSAEIFGLPFASRNDPNRRWIMDVVFGNQDSGLTDPIVLVMQPGVTKVPILRAPFNASSTFLTNTGFTNTSTIAMSGWYETE